MRRLFGLLEGAAIHEAVTIAHMVVDLVRVIAVQKERAHDAAITVKNAPMRRLRLHKEGIAFWTSLKDQIAHGEAGDIKWREIQDYFRRTWYRPAPMGTPPA
ncbi:MAG TPA: hypothetical protein VJA16_06965 [Thermoanaerobaculia bacterium]